MTASKKVKSRPKPVPFKIYADFESNLESVKSYEGFYSKNIKNTFLVFLLVFIYNTVQINQFCIV